MTEEKALGCSAVVGLPSPAVSVEVRVGCVCLGLLSISEDLGGYSKHTSTDLL